MNDTQLLTIAAALVATMFGLLCAVLGWIGSRAISKLDELVATLGTVKDELHDRITSTERRISDQFVLHDRRLSKLETRCDIHHGDAS